MWDLHRLHTCLQTAQQAQNHMRIHMPHMADTEKINRARRVRAQPLQRDAKCHARRGRHPIPHLCTIPRAHIHRGHGMRAFRKTSNIGRNRAIRTPTI